IDQQRAFLAGALLQNLLAVRAGIVGDCCNRARLRLSRNRPRGKRRADKQGSSANRRWMRHLTAPVPCRPRESGDPWSRKRGEMDPRFRGDDNMEQSSPTGRRPEALALPHLVVFAGHEEPPMSAVQQAICTGLLVLLCAAAGPGQAQPAAVAAIANY